MNIDTYILAQRNTFLILPAGAVPPCHIDMTGAKPFKQMVLNRSDKPIAMDADEVLDDIEEQGWAVAGAAVIVG